MTLSAGYSQVATTIAQLKAITAANRSPNFALLLPATGSWYYYHSTSSESPDDLTVIQPDDGVGRWIAVSLQVILSAAASAANGAIASHNADSNPHSQYHRTDGVLIASQPNSTTPAYSARVATGNGSNSGGFQVLTPAGNPAVSIGADSNNRGVITAGPNGLVIGGSPNELVSFFGKVPAVTRPNAIALPGNNTTDMRRAINELINAARSLGAIAP